VNDLADNLLLDLLEWVAQGERSYDEVMDAWRTSCPRFPIWENARARELLFTEHRNDRSIVKVTALGLELLNSCGRHL
jgi:hypothetical protein